MNYRDAKQIAVTACYALQPYCDRINIAGSIRRQKPEVKDIEVIAIPKRMSVTSYNLFGEESTSESIIDPRFIQTVEALGKVLKGKPIGRYMQILLPEGINLDLFLPQEHDYFRQYAIRTGSADYAARILAYGWKRQGWCGTEDGLRLQKQCVEKKVGGKSVWTCTHPNPTLPPAWSDEKSFFAWLGAAYLEPKDRNV